MSPPPANGPAPSSASTIASLPPTEVMSRSWNFPIADEAKVRQMVTLRLEADLPVPVDQLVWGYRQTKGTLPEDTSSRVLVQAARAERVEQLLGMWLAAGIRPDVLTTEAEAIGTLYRHGLKLTAGKAADVLALATDEQWLIAVIEQGKVRLIRRIRITSAGVDAACRECEQSVGAELPLRDLSRVLWCASPERATAGQALAQRLGAALEPVTAAEHLRDAAGQLLGPEQLAVFGPAIGLALAEWYERDQIIRLDGREQQSATRRGQRMQFLLAYPWRWLAAASASLVFAAAIHVGGITCESRKMQYLLDQGDRRGEAIKELDPKVQAMQRLEKYRIDVEGIMAALTAALPDSLIISSVQVARERRLTVKGTAKDPKAIFTFADALRKSDRFASVQPERTEPGQGGSFTITAELTHVEKLTSSGRRGGRWH